MDPFNILDILEILDEEVKEVCTCAVVTIRCTVYMIGGGIAVIECECVCECEYAAAYVGDSNCS